MKTYKAKSVILANLWLFRGFWTPFGALGTQREFFRKIFKKLDMKIQPAAKFQKKLMDGYRALVRTHARTHATENNGPSPINRGTKIQLAAKFQKKLMDGYRALVQTHGCTDARTYGRH